MIARGLGGIPSPPDPADWLLSSTAAYRAVAADGADLGNVRLPVVGPVLDQGGTPECVAYALAGGKAHDEFLQLGRWPRYDAADLYRRAQAIDGIPMPHDGTTVRAALQVAVSRGLTDTVTGHRYLLGSYYNLMAEADPFLAAGAAIALGRPVYLGFDWYPDWFGDSDASGDWPGGVLPQPHGAQEGGHAVWAWGVRTAPADLAIPTGYRGGTVRVARGERLLRTRWAWGPTAGNGHGNVDIPESLFRAVGHDLWATVDR